MEEIIAYAFDSGALNNIILSVVVIWFMWFGSRYWWPNRVEQMRQQQEINTRLREKEIDAHTEIEKLKIQGQIDIYKKVIRDMEEINTSIVGLQATFNDFLQNILSQFIEDRRELIDTGIFRRPSDIEGGGK